MAYLSSLLINDSYDFSLYEQKNQVTFSDHLSLSDLCKRFSYLTTWSVLPKLGIKRPLVNEIQVCSNESPHPFPWVSNSKIGKIHHYKAVCKIIEIS